MPTRTVRGSTKHEQLTRTLREMAQNLQPGELFPSQTELMRNFHVSDRTVLRSLDDLQRDGWIVRRHGIGTFVADPKERKPEPPRPVATDTRTLAALTPSLISFYKHCVDLLTGQVEDRGLSLVCHHTQHPASFYQDALPLEALNPRGFLLFSYAMLPVARRLLERGHRAVIMGAPPADVHPTAPTVYGDHEQGGYLATRHLLDLGHRRLAYAYNSADQPHPLLRRLRWQGHQRALREATREGLSVEATLIDPDRFACWSLDPSAAASYLRGGDAPTGIAVWNDREAGLLLHILHRAGVGIPEEVSVIGYDALPESGESHPALSTVDQHIESQLRASLDLLCRPSVPPATQSVIVVPTLVVRASCGPPRGC